MSTILLAIMYVLRRSQKEWLDTSQGMDSYLNEMVSQARTCGSLSGKFEFAEGWIRRLHLGFCNPDDDPLTGFLA